MSYTKRSFTLIEVIIAILLATGACVFLLQFESTLLNRSRHSVKKLEMERVKQRASALLFENLYTNQIPWKALLEGKDFSLEIPNSAWVAQWQFKTTQKLELIEPDFAKVEATLVLVHGREKVEQEGPLKFEFFIKKEVGGNA